MQDVFAETKCQFVILIDEWDCLFREYKQDKEAQKKYLDFLRMWLKDKEYVALAYMTGILPIKKYGSHSALNMFSEYSMLNPREMAEFLDLRKKKSRSFVTNMAEVLKKQKHGIMDMSYLSWKQRNQKFMRCIIRNL